MAESLVRACDFNLPSEHTPPPSLQIPVRSCDSLPDETTVDATLHHHSPIPLPPPPDRLICKQPTTIARIFHPTELPIPYDSPPTSASSIPPTLSHYRNVTDLELDINQICDPQQLQHDSPLSHPQHSTLDSMPGVPGIECVSTLEIAEQSVLGPIRSSSRRMDADDVLDPNSLSNIPLAKPSSFSHDQSSPATHPLPVAHVLSERTTPAAK
ncbi:hypothetical protein M5K25_010347 [Dendrobium thyrsiflorum]|uniref:Uncharacterized protein n=1 Tax=Dendrobium thyrsiflorum TaxID=117978 RepID=A0ABD0V7A7_DENTH